MGLENDHDPAILLHMRVEEVVFARVDGVHPAFGIKC